MGNLLFRSPEPGRKGPQTLVFIEGNISAGKSTLIQGLREKGFVVWEENLTKLTGSHFGDETGKSILQLFYGDMKEYGFKLQLASLTSRWEIIKEALQSDADVVFVERSHLTDRYSFAVNLYEQGLISPLDWKLYEALVEQHIHDANKHFEGISVKWIYLKADPDTCLRRMTERGRPEESGVSIEYLTSLHSKLEAWSKKCEHVIDATRDKEVVLEDVINIAVEHPDEPVIDDSNSSDSEAPST